MNAENVTLEQLRELRDAVVAARERDNRPCATIDDAMAYSEARDEYERAAIAYTLQELDRPAPEPAAMGVDDACARMRALCEYCGGTGEVHRADGEWLGSCDCAASKAPPAPAAREAVPQNVMDALDRMCTPLDESWLKGATAAADKRCMDIIRTYILTTPPPEAAGEWVVPEGWALVPDEMTEAMLLAVKQAHHDHSDFEDWLEFDGQDAQNDWEAALAAAPPPAGAGKGVAS